MRERIISKLDEKGCMPCRGGIPPMKRQMVSEYLRKVNGWTLVSGKKIRKRFILKDFSNVMAFVNRVADTAEKEGHHPDICIHYNKTDMALWTHKIKGLHENDFIMAAKIDKIAGSYKSYKNRR